MNKYTEQEIKKLTNQRNFIYALSMMQTLLSGASMGLAINNASNKHLALTLFYGVLCCYCLNRSCAYNKRVKQINKEIDNIRRRGSR